MKISCESTIHDCKIIELNKHHSVFWGNLSAIENQKDIPFDIRRVYYLYDIPGGESRGGHAHKELYQLMIAAGGSFDVILDDGKEKCTYTLNRPYQSLLIVPGIWRELVNFSSGSTCLVLASLIYEEGDYIRSYGNFLEYKNNTH